MRTTHPYIQMPKGDTMGSLPADLVYEYVSGLPDPLGVLFDAVRRLRRDEQLQRDKDEKLKYETKECNQKTGG